MFLVTGPHVLEPDLGDSLGQAGQIGDAFQILAVGIGILREVGVEHVELLLGERRPHAFRFAATASFGVHF